MQNRVMRSLVMGAAALLALSFWLLWRTPGRDAFPSAIPEPATAAERPELAPPSAPGSAAEPSVVLDDAQRTAEGLCAQGAWARVFVVGQVTTATRSLEHALVVARPIQHAALSRGGAAALAGWSELEGGRFRIELTRAFDREMDVLPSKLAMQVLLDDTAPVEFEIPVPFGRAELERGGELLVQADTRLPEVCRVAGRAFAPGENHVGLIVAAFALQDGRPAARPSAVAHADAASGEYTLTLDCESDFVLLGFVDGWRPASLHIGAERRTPPDLVVERGVALAGRFVVGAAREVTLVARRTRESSRFPTQDVNGVAFLWSDGRFEWASVSTRTRADGSFELRGLAPGEYGVRPPGTPDADESLDWTSVVVAPAAGLELPTPQVPMRFQVWLHGAPVPDELVSGVEFRADGSSRTFEARADAQGRFEVWADRGSRLRVRSIEVRVEGGPADRGEPTRIGD